MMNFIKETFTVPQSIRLNKTNGYIDKNKRIEFIDLAKGICILLVVLLHSGIEFFNLPNLVALRMPLYFFLSGLFFKPYLISEFFIKKTNNILIPFLFFIFLSDLWLKYICKIEADFTLISLFKDPNTKRLISNCPLWFLLCLFETNFLAYGIIRYMKEPKKIILAVSILTAIGVFVSTKGIILPVWLDSTLLALPFFFAGYFFKRTELIYQNIRKRNLVFITLLCLLVSYGIYLLYDSHIVFMSTEIEGNALLAYINSLSFVIAIMALCKLMVWLPVISYLGRYSIILLGLHAPLLIYIPYIAFRLFGYHINLLYILPFIFLICWLCIPLMKKYLPHFVAQKPLIPIFRFTKNKITC